MLVLFVENNETFAQTVISAFMADMDVEVIGSVPGAIDRLRNAPPFDAMLVDFDLDEGKGTQVVEFAREAGFTGRIVAVSSHEPGNTALLKAGADAVCPKADFGSLRSTLGC